MTVSHIGGLVPSAAGAGIDQADRSQTYRGIDIRIHTEQTPESCWGRADLFDGPRFRGRLSIGDPKATPMALCERLAALAQARIEIWRAMERDDLPSPAAASAQRSERPGLQASPGAHVGAQRRSRQRPAQRARRRDAGTSS